MCIGCWREYGSPTIDNVTVRAAVCLIGAVYDAPGGSVGGGLHCILDDYNIEDGFLAGGDQDLHNDHERACLAALRTMTLDERASALALYDGYWTPGVRWDETESTALDDMLAFAGMLGGASISDSVLKTIAERGFRVEAMMVSSPRTGLVRYRVTCTKCGVAVCEASTTPDQLADAHDREKHRG